MSEPALLLHLGLTTANIPGTKQGRPMESDGAEIIGGPKNFCIYSKDKEYDLTHSHTPKSPPIYPRIPLQTTNARVAIDPTKAALVVVDLQNYFLSPALGRPSDVVGIKVVDNLLKYAISACRQAAIPIVSLGWGLSEEDIDAMPPTIVKGFAADNSFDGPRVIGGLGSEVGEVNLEDGSVIDGGRVLMHAQWNQEFYVPLKERQQEQDVVVSKNRLSGLWDGTKVEEALTSRGIRTLFFAGANLDQCVSGSIQGALTKGFDCLLLSDGAATTSAAFAKQCIEYNTEEGWGFLLFCEDLVRGVDEIESGPAAKL